MVFVRTIGLVTGKKVRDKGMKITRIELRLQAEEKQAFKDAAKLAGISLSSWARERLRGAARRELEDAGHPIAFLSGVRLE